LWTVFRAVREILEIISGVIALYMTLKKIRPKKRKTALRRLSSNISKQRGH
jgi:hypothetical protein